MTETIEDWAKRLGYGGDKRLDTLRLAQRAIEDAIENGESYARKVVEDGVWVAAHAGCRDGRVVCELFCASEVGEVACFETIRYSEEEAVAFSRFDLRKIADVPLMLS